MNVKIKDIPLNDRPRERLLNCGSNSLSNEELLSIILKTGTKNVSVKNIAINLLKQIGDIKNLNNITLEELMKIKGIGKIKAIELIASIELGKRINETFENINEIKIINPLNIYNYYKDKLKNKKQECFYCIYLNSKSVIIKENLLFMGTINQSLVHPREIFREAYLSSASSFICIHNHPSGSNEPSENDINLTKQLKDIGEYLGVKLLDHVIIGKNYFSFKENGLI